jgi:hypothetical protein
MRSIGQFFSKIFDGATSTTSIQREWDRQRSRAISPNELSEIDAIFGRSI